MGGEDEADDMDDCFDKFEVAKAVDISKEFGAEWIDKLGALSQWNAKVEKLQQLFQASDVAKLKQEASYVDLTEMLKKLLKDSNAVVQQNSVKCIGNLAKAIRKPFGPHAKDLFPLLVLKFKERRLADDIQIAFDNFLLCTTLCDFIESVKTGVNDPLPQIRKNVTVFCQKAVVITYIDDLQEIQRDLLSAAALVANDKDTAIRDDGLKLVGLLKGRLGEAAVSSVVENMIPLKKAKVDEACASVKPSQYDVS